MSNFLPFFVYILLSLSLGQDCTWNVTGVSQPFSLIEAQGYHAMCFDTSGGQPGYSYTITACGNYAQCEPGNLVMGTLFDRNYGVCVATTAMWDNGATQPTLMYMDGQPTFHFKYTDGNKQGCDTFTMNVYWKCDENMPPPFGPASSNICFADNTCESSIIIPTPYACVGDYQECTWYVPGAQDAFSLIDAKGFQAMCYDTSNGIPGYAYTITPCGDFVQCNPGQFSMGNYIDRTSGQCLGQTTSWDDGQTIPTYYDLGSGRRGWRFRYANGNKLGCDTFYMNVDYVCDPDIRPPFGPAAYNYCYSISECESYIEIPSPYGCVVGPTSNISSHNASVNMHVSSLM